MGPSSWLPPPGIASGQESTTNQQKTTDRLGGWLGLTQRAYAMRVFPLDSNAMNSTEMRAASNLLEYVQRRISFDFEP